MTREEDIKEVLRLYFDDDCFGQDFEVFVDNMHDDFESRTCENCKYAKDMDYQYMHCSNKNRDTPKFVFLSSKCGRFEGKSK